MAKEKRESNTEKEYNDAVAADDPTKDISNEQLQDMAKEAIKKFKSLN